MCYASNVNTYILSCSAILTPKKPGNIHIYIYIHIYTHMETFTRVHTHIHTKALCVILRWNVAECAVLLLWRLLFGINICSPSTRSAAIKVCIYVWGRVQGPPHTAPPASITQVQSPVVSRSRTMTHSLCAWEVQTKRPETPATGRNRYVCAFLFVCMFMSRLANI